jgi:hypothetical protein
MIDDKGRIFGKINLIDFFIILIVLILVPVFFAGQRLISKSYKENAAQDDIIRAFGPKSQYVIERNCPNCGKPVSIAIKTGIPVSEILYYKTICLNCRCEVVVLDKKEYVE